MNADVPKNKRGRPTSKWQIVRHTTAAHPAGTWDFGVDDGINVIWYANEKQAQAAVAYARAFGYIPNDPRSDAWQTM